MQQLQRAKRSIESFKNDWLQTFGERVYLAMHLYMTQICIPADKGLPPVHVTLEQMPTYTKAWNKLLQAALQMDSRLPIYFGVDPTQHESAKKIACIVRYLFVYYML
jgi:hypothetical protein